MQLHVCFCWQPYDSATTLCSSLGRFSSSHNCAGFNWIGQFHCHNPNANNGRSTFRLHQEREELSYSFFVNWKWISGQNPYKFFSIMWEQNMLQRSVYIWMKTLQIVPHVTKEEIGTFVTWYSAKTFFSERQKKLVLRWKKCIENKEKTLKNNVILSFIFLLKQS
jgi:hypothetical protein